MKNLVRCAAIAKKDGQRCGRRAAAGELLCHIHRAAAEGKPVSALTVPTVFDPREKLLRIASRDGHVHQMAAIKILMNQEKCQACAARAAAEDPDEHVDIWGDVTDHEGERLRVLIAEIQPRLVEYKQIKGAVIARIKQGPKQ